MDQHPRATQILALVAEAEGAAASRKQRASGVLRVTTAAVFGVHLLDRLAIAYQQRHPEVTVELSVNERVVDIVEEGFDSAIRITREVAPGFVARRLAPCRVIACASRGYLKRHGVPKTPEDLGRHNCLFYSGSSYRNDWTLRSGNESRTVRVSGDLRSNTGQVLVTAALEGRGIIFEPAFLVDEALRDGRLVRVLPQWSMDEFAIFAVYPNRKFLPAKVRTFVDFLVEQLGDVPPWERPH